MSESRSPLPEFSQLLAKASDAMHEFPNVALTSQQRAAVTDLISFMRDYDVVILDELQS